MSNLSKLRIVAGIMMFGILGLAFPAFAQDETAAVTAAEQINSANALVRQGNFDNAIEKYQRITASAKDRDELNYNQAVALYRKGDLEMAEALFAEAASSDDSSIAPSGRYNLGNCWYAKALQNVEQNKPAAIEQLREAIEHYRGSLNGNSDNSDARANIELAAKLISKLQEEQKQEEQKQEEQQQQQKQQQQDNQESQSENADSQQSESEECDCQDSRSPEDSEAEGNEDQQQQDPSSESKSNDQSSQQSDQSESEEQNPSESDESEQSKAENKQSQNEESDSLDQQDGKPQNDEQSTDQRPAHQGSQENPPQPADEQIGDENDDEGKKQVPMGDLTSAEQADEDAKANGSVTMADPNSDDGLMTKEEALKMLQAVRDNDMLRRLKRQRQERSRHIPVDRDW